MKISKSFFGQIDNNDVDLYTLENDNGVIVKISNYGGTVTSIIVPDKNGTCADIVCGFDSLYGYFSEAYKKNSPYFGCLVGRTAGRIKDGQFSVDGVNYKVAQNNETNHLHGGVVGFDKVIWDAQPLKAKESVALKLLRTSPDGEEGYPGNLSVVVTFTLNNDNELCIDYAAITDKTTPVSLTNHTYFNLNGFQEKILDHSVQIIADKFLLPDETNVPVGDEKMVAGTVWDYNQPKPIAAVFDEEPMGFETFYVFSKPVGEYAQVAEIHDAQSGRRLVVSSSDPGMLFYSGCYTSDELQREDGTPFGQFRAFCCETSKYPNGVNIPDAPQSLLKPGEKYESKTVYKFIW